ncbi:fimbria/pilus periplasmic chaperone [Klebsiella oxytoca]|nr:MULTISPECIES: fimbria/pilus periplasmic chaperone [Klebsiella]MCO4160963.1 fimbria/pilus periplasmic chaperone [Citrobacter amalonaticus]EIZ1086427.1 fimbria/pilus periplasmic chaperone [Klebsiella oxytoca]MBZ7264436.1 fimbria/pilus periplasmic chaperone [Klebsiella oxytoca]MCW9547407.1 fimbria/pilus periplasmic chaperone [Klebsiella oxytoca]VUS44651.1 putative fimbrial chaperone YadV [Klebsiella pasteurii]
MNFSRITVFTGIVMVMLTSPALSGVVLDGTRVIYPADKRDITVRLTNMGERPVLVQSWLDKGDESATPDKIVVPFMLAPPVNRIEPKRAQSLRISTVRGASLPQDRESVFWLNVLEIPAKPDTAKAGDNYLQLAVRTRIKFFWRPVSLSGAAWQAPEGMVWTAENGGLKVQNPSPYHISLIEVAFNGKKYGADMIPPHESQTVSIPSIASGHSVTAVWLDDYGARREKRFTVN